MTRLIIAFIVALWSLPVSAQTVIDQTVKQGVEVIFHVQEGTNSPYQGRLLYTPSAPNQSQITTDELAQYQTWKANQVLSPAQLTAQEIAQNVDMVATQGSVAQISLVSSTANQNLAALRAAYHDANQTRAIMIADFLGTLTNAQLVAIFSLTLQQVQTLRTNTLTPAATVAASIRAAAGN